MDFSKVVKNQMDEANLKKSELARRTGYSYQYISDLLAGNRRWNETTITKVSEVLGIKIKFVTDEVKPTGTES